MHFRFVRALAVLLLSSSLSVAAQPAIVPIDLTIDLATLEPGAERTFSIDPGVYLIKIVNKAPALKYKITIDRSTVEIPPLPALAPVAGLAPNPCPQLHTDSVQLSNTQDEKQVSLLVPRVEAGLAACQDQASKDTAQRLIDSTREQPGGQQKVDFGERLKVTVVATVGNATRTWIVTYQTAARGRWVSSYGFTFLPSEDERFFAEAKVGEVNKFTITEKKDRQDLTFAPSVFFSWFPAQDEPRNWSFSWSAGLGFDQSNPIVFAGPTWTYHQNIGVMFGVVMHKQKRLNGQYDRGQEVMANLTEAQLHEETYRPNAFLV